MLTDLIKGPANLTSERLYEIRATLTTYLRRVIPDIDVSPGSPAGDLIVNVATYMAGMLEQGVNDFFKIIDLQRTSDVSPYADTVTEILLKLYGYRPDIVRTNYNVIRLISTRNRILYFDASTQFSKNDSKFKPVIPTGTTLTVGTTFMPLLHKWKVSQVAGQFYCDIPVVVTDLSDNIAPETEMLIEGIEAIEGVYAKLLYKATIDTNAITLKDMVTSTLRTFAKPGLSYKENLKSYIFTTYNQLVKDVAIVTSQEPGYSRPSTNILGIKLPGVDVYIKGSNIESNKRPVYLTYNSELSTFEGKLIDSKGILAIDKTSLEDFGTPADITIVENVIGEVGVRIKNSAKLKLPLVTDLKNTFTTNSGSYLLNISGIYTNDMFDTPRQRQLTLRFNKVATTVDGHTAVYFSVEDGLSGARGVIAFIKKSGTQSNRLTCDLNSSKLVESYARKGYLKFIKGLTLEITKLSENGTPSLLGDYELSQVGNLTLPILAPETTAAAVTAYNDPTLAIIDANKDSFDADFSALQIKKFKPAEVVALNITLKAPITLNKATVKNLLVGYISKKSCSDTLGVAELYNLLQPFGVTDIIDISPIIYYRDTLADIVIKNEVETTPTMVSANSFNQSPTLIIAQKSLFTYIITTAAITINLV